jgi:hypothetical protein
MCANMKKYSEIKMKIHILNSVEYYFDFTLNLIINCKAYK